MHDHVRIQIQGYYNNYYWCRAQGSWRSCMITCMSRNTTARKTGTRPPGTHSHRDCWVERHKAHSPLETRNWRCSGCLLPLLQRSKRSSCRHSLENRREKARLLLGNNKALHLQQTAVYNTICKSTSNSKNDMLGKNLSCWQLSSGVSWSREEKKP